MWVRRAVFLLLFVALLSTNTNCAVAAEPINVGSRLEPLIDDYLIDFAQNNAALKRLPLGREVAEVCLFLASNKASAVTGQCINVDCGVLPQ